MRCISLSDSRRRLRWRFGSQNFNHVTFRKTIGCIIDAWSRGSGATSVTGFYLVDSISIRLPISPRLLGLFNIDLHTLGARNRPERGCSWMKVGWRDARGHTWLPGALVQCLVVRSEGQTPRGISVRARHIWCTTNLFFFSWRGRPLCNERRDQQQCSFYLLALEI